MLWSTMQVNSTLQESTYTKVSLCLPICETKLSAFRVIALVRWKTIGYGLAGPMELVTPEQLEHQYKTNLFGPVYIMQSVLPHFRKKKKGVIVNVTSVGGRITLPFNSLYHGTKFGLEAISECVNMELKPFESIRVKTLEPGGVSTDFAGRSLVMTSSDTIKDYDPIIGRALEKFGTRTEGTSTPEQVAEVIWEAATDGKDQIRYVAGEDAKKYLASRKKQTDEEYEAEMVEVFNLLGDAKKGGAANAK